MSYVFRIPIAQSYASAIGRAAYNFAYLEWGIICIGEKIQPGFINVVEGKPAGSTASHFGKVLSSASTLDPHLNARLKKLAASFEDLAKKRNLLLHGTPMTAPDQEQLLRYFGKGKIFEWGEEDILKAAEDFELAAIEANDIFHNGLT
jgi:hypothetical protein